MDALALSADDPITPRAGTRLEGRALGIDVGGTGVKAAVVDLASGELASERIREKTPQPATPEAVADTIARVLERISAGGTSIDAMPAGCGLPGVVKGGHLMTTANIDRSWRDVSAEQVIGERIGRSVLAINDADAAGVAEMTYGVGAGENGTVLLLTIGTGIGSALFIDRLLVPNTELGHLEMGGKDAEKQVSGTSRERRKLSWKRWAKEFNGYLSMVEAYLWPDLLILGGGVSKEWTRFEGLVETRAPVRPARLLNAAGIVGAAMAAAYAERVRSGAAPRAEGGGDGASPDTTREETIDASQPTVVRSLGST